MIYCVEDDAGIRELVVYTLQNTGMEARGLEDGGALFAALREKKPQLILLDIMLPGEDGISILRRLRDTQETADIPVILLTSKNTEYDKVVGLDSGADDYVAKPFGMMELVARIRAVLRRTQAGGRRDLRGRARAQCIRRRARSAADAQGVSAAVPADEKSWCGAYARCAARKYLGLRQRERNQNGGRAHPHPAAKAGHGRGDD